MRAANQGTCPLPEDVASLLIAVSTLLVGRTGLFLGVLLIPLVLVLGRTRSSSAPRRVGRVALPLTIVGGCTAAIIAVVLQRLPEQFVMYNIARAGEVLVAFTDPGESGTVRAVRRPRKPIKSSKKVA